MKQQIMIIYLDHIQLLMIYTQTMYTYKLINGINQGEFPKKKPLDNPNMLSMPGDVFLFCLIVMNPSIHPNITA